MEENMSENFDELGELGDKIKKIIDTAVSVSYTHLAINHFEQIFCGNGSARKDILVNSGK